VAVPSRLPFGPLIRPVLRWSTLSLTVRSDLRSVLAVHADFEFTTAPAYAGGSGNWVPSNVWVYEPAHAKSDERNGAKRSTENFGGSVSNRGEQTVAEARRVQAPDPENDISEEAIDPKVLGNVKLGQNKVPIRPVPTPKMVLQPNGLPVGVTKDAGIVNPEVLQ